MNLSIEKSVECGDEDVFECLANPELLEVISPDGKADIGGSQYWYTDKWQKKAGCGPTTAANLMWYFARSRSGMRGLCEYDGGEREPFVRLMLEMFNYVTPGVGGVNTSALFTGGVEKYCESRGVNLTTRVLEIPMPFVKRPCVEQMRDFVLEGLRLDSPVAFLNLSNGTVRKLDYWHWVTILAIEPTTLATRISDQGEVIEINLGEWLSTSVLGGAMVYLVAG